jgi:hypothetical protein
MGLHLSEEFWLAADALAGHRMMQSPTQQQVRVLTVTYLGRNEGEGKRMESRRRFRKNDRKDWDVRSEQITFET